MINSVQSAYGTQAISSTQQSRAAQQATQQTSPSGDKITISESAKAYEKAPYAAMAKYGHLFNGMNDEEFSMIIGGKDS